MLKAKDIMSSPVVWVPITHSILDAVNLMVKENIGCVIVGGKKSFLPLEKLGILTERDITRIIAEKTDIGKLSLSEGMTTPLIYADIEADLCEVSNLMTSHNLRRIPVTSEGMVVGIVSSKDVTRALRYSRAKWICKHESDDKAGKA